MKVSLLGMFTAFAVVLSYVESFLPVVGIPGIKLGLANLSIILVLYLFGYKDALLVSVVRILIVGMMFGSMFTIVYSLAGAFLSLGMMVIIRKVGPFQIQSVSVVGGVCHNLGQLIVAAVVVDSYNVFMYFPMLLISGIITGLAIGIAADIIYKRTADIIKNR